MRTFLTPVFLAALTAATLAQDAAEAVLYVPSAGAGSAGRVVYSSGAEAPVLDYDGIEAPADCPDGAFWVKNQASLISCNGETAYRFVQPTGDFPASMSALGLKRIKGPPFGTDDGGPLLDDGEGAQQ